LAGAEGFGDWVDPGEQLHENSMVTRGSGGGSRVGKGRVARKASSGAYYAQDACAQADSVGSCGR
jgi:hypothetical protein